MDKNLLRNFAKRSASLAFPNKTSVSLSFDSNTDGWTEFVAPSDGYLFISAHDNTKSLAEIQFRGKSSSSGISSVWTVVEKDQMFRYAARGTSRTATFVPCRFV